MHGIILGMDDDALLDSNFARMNLAPSTQEMISSIITGIRYLQRMLQFFFVQAYDIHAGIHGFQA